MLKVRIPAILLLVVFYSLCGGQLRHVRYLDHAEYMVDVIGATMVELERRSWSNLKLPVIQLAINETIFGHEALGTITYTNGFLVSIERVDIQQSTVQQVWNWTHVGLVDFRARMRMHDVVVGFDAIVNLTTTNHHYTGTYRHPMVYFDFSIINDMNENTITTNVVGVTPTSTNMVRYMPSDNISDVLTTLYNRGSTISGVNAWGPEVITPILDDVVRNKVKFPTICYNCP